MTIALCILFSVYLLTMVYLMIGWQKAISASYGSVDEPKVYPSITVLIPFRNEEANLPLLLDDLQHMKGDIESLRIILIDDHCTDETVARLEKFLDSQLSIELVQNNGEGKVSALRTGAAQVSTEYIVTLDADIRLTQDWLRELKAVLSDRPDMCILPIHGFAGRGLASRYAQLDFMSLIGVTFSMAAHGRPVMANGAQLVMKTDNARWKEGIVSGDDVFAMHAVKASGGSVTYALTTSLTARTAMPSSWSGVWSQRLRWASKSMNYQDKDTLILGWVVLTVNVALWVLFFWSLSHRDTLSLFLAMLLGKAIVDLLFLGPVMRWFSEGHRLILFPMAFLLNLIQYPLVFVVGRLSGFKWKDRTYRI